MYAELSHFDRRPEPFSVTTTRTLWTDPHIAARMLAFHLDPDGDLASRSHATIERIVAWLDRRFGFDGRAVTDLGCGPGLYASRFARRGARVTGLDFSASSIAHARATAPDDAPAIDYRIADYLVDPLPAGQDLVTLIYGDFCALPPAARRRLLDRIRGALADGGRLVFDVFSTASFDGLVERRDWGHDFMGGFWSDADYFGLLATILYPAEKIGLDHYLIAEERRRFEIFNWMQYYDPETITAELAAGGFRVEAVLEVASGEPISGLPEVFAVVAAPV